MGTVNFENIPNVFYLRWNTEIQENIFLTGFGLKAYDCF